MRPSYPAPIAAFCHSGRARRSAPPGEAAAARDPASDLRARLTAGRIERAASGPARGGPGDAHPGPANRAARRLPPVRRRGRGGPVGDRRAGDRGRLPGGPRHRPPGRDRDRAVRDHRRRRAGGPRRRGARHAWAAATSSARCRSSTACRGSPRSWPTAPTRCLALATLGVRAARPRAARRSALAILRGLSARLRATRPSSASTDRIAVITPDPPPTALPTGTVAFVFTDIEGSTRLAQTLPADRWEARPRASPRAASGRAVEAHGGTR